MRSATKSPLSAALFVARPHVAPESLLEYFGTVNYATNERVLGELKRRATAGLDTTLVVTSAGGPSGTAMSFYDTVRRVLGAPLTTIGSGDVDSSGMILFLSGTRRFVTAHTSSLLHLAGRTFEQGKRYSASDLAAMAAEDELKDRYYADIVASASGGALSAASVLELMAKNTVLTPDDFISYGLAEAVL